MILCSPNPHLSTSQKVRQIPNAISDSRFHGGRDAQGLVNAHEVVPREVQAIRGPQVLPLFTEGVRQPREPAHLHSDREVLALDVGRAHFRGIGVAHDWDLLRV